ncbi:DUF1108 family protein [Staphylococcus ureilyticus]|uniref:DUF1108 family protein n=1 Tax=Staphylococcus ureilyticus TaxID=94138 RepID=UPI00321B969E
MYFRINDEEKKKINVLGYNFILRVRKNTQFEVEVSIETLDLDVIDSIVVADEEIGLRSAQELLEQSVFNWIEENTDEADRIMNSVLSW